MRRRVRRIAAVMGIGRVFASEPPSLLEPLVLISLPWVTGPVLEDLNC
jgi:hypothetical protein